MVDLLTLEDLKQTYEKLPRLYSDGIIKIPPDDAEVAYEYLHQKAGKFGEVPEYSSGWDDETGERFDDTRYPKEEENRQLGEHIKITSQSDSQFLVFDVDGILIDFGEKLSMEYLELLVRLIKLYTEYQIKQCSEFPQDLEARVKPHKELYDQAVGWLSRRTLEDINIKILLTGLINDDSPNENVLSDSVPRVLQYDGKNYNLTERQYQIIFVLNQTQDSGGGGLRNQSIKSIIDKEFSDNRTPKSFKIHDYFKDYRKQLMSTLIVSDKRKPAKYSLSVALGSI